MRQLAPRATRAPKLAPAWLALALAVTGILGCSVTLISRYDEQIDRSATTLQVQMDSMLTWLDAEPQPSHEEARPFYRDYLVRLRSVQIRAQSQPKNEITEKQIELMMQNVALLDSAHASGPLDPATINTLRELFNAGWRAIIQLELAKKRGDG